MDTNKSKSLVFANIILGTSVVIFILAIILLWYRSNSLQVPFNFKIGILLAAGLFVSIAALYMHSEWKVNIAMTIFSAVIAIYSIEFVLFANYNSLYSQSKVDKRNKLEILEDMRTDGIDAWPQVPSWLFIKPDGLQHNNNRIFPLGGISNKTVVNCNESGQYAIFESDGYGFNNPKGLHIKGNVKIVFLGDSFTLGHCVQSGEDLPSQFRNIAGNALNLGNGGNGPLIELSILNEYIKPLEPDVVLWIYYEGNDLLDLERERKSSILMSYLEDRYTQNLREKQDTIDDVLIQYANDQWEKTRYLQYLPNQPGREQKIKEERAVMDIVKLWYLRDRLGLLYTQNQTSNPNRMPSFKTQLPLFTKVLAAARQRTSNWGGEFYFVYLPKMERYVNNNNHGSFYDRDDILAIVNDLGIALIDFTKIMNNYPDPLSLAPFVSAHYNAKGYRLVAEMIATQLKKDDIVSAE